VSHRIQFRMLNVTGVFSSHDNMISLRMCENFNFPTVAENVQQYDSHQQLLTGRNRTGRGGCVD
jgi:hypothetical protein